MALIVEDGSKVANANSYQSVDDLRTFATARNITTLPAIDADCEALLLKAMDALAEFGNRWQGIPTYTDQALAWPRYGAYVNGLQIDSRSIPYELKYAQLQLAIEAISSDLQENDDGKGAVISEKVGPIEKTYETRGKIKGVSAFSKPMAQINLLLKRGGFQLIRS